mmetsp:Transcript_5903/g.14006  ORF Transcript_5903/g.14006 Transcript_5903/m.14006 type:complete len:146 (-) Transcript_5903:172-609(-)
MNRCSLCHTCTRAPLALLAVLAPHAVTLCSAAGAVGRPAAVRAASTETQALVDPFREAAQKRALEAGAAGNFTKWEARQLRTQLVAGTNYFVKVAVSDDKCVHLRIYQPLPHTKEPARLVAVKLDQNPEEDVAYFEASEGTLGEL